MNKNAILRKVNKYPEGAKIAKLFPAIAGGRLAECKNVDADCLRMLNLSGNNEELTLQFLIDSYVIATKEGNSVLTEDGAFLGRMMGGEFVVSENALELFSEEEEDIELDSHKEQYEDYDGYVEDTGLLDGNESTEVLEDEGNKEVKEEISADEKQIMQYYSAYYNGVVQELLKRYNAMFSSGYQLQRPAGILTIEGIVKLSGSERVIGENSVSTYNIYNLVKSNIGFTEYPDRSITNIANILYNGYQQGSDLLYFPNKMLEFAFGVESPKSDNQNSLKNYNKHSKANSWSGYVTSELESSIRHLIGKTTYGYVVMEMRNQEIEDFRDNRIGVGLKNYLEYAKACLSFCILFPEYKVAKTNNGVEVSSFKLRVCDPTGSLLSTDLTPEIIQEAFMGSAGKDAFSYSPDVKEDCFVVEYSHEFNHAMSQATPLFAYKALESIKNNGEELSWDKMILGLSTDGSILRSIPADSNEKGIKLGVNLTHQIEAGSRAGKGVMTLNILASGIASRKNIFYLDRKPDMASLFKYLSPNMFVINGADYQEQYDTYKTWTPEVTKAMIGTIPDEVLEAFGITPTWSNLSDLYYMRALKLVVGIIMLRGSMNNADERLGGQTGILCVVDEFTNFQSSYMSLISKLTNFTPNIKIDEARLKVKDKKMTEESFSRAYNNRNYYALSYMLCAMKDVEYINSKKNAGFNPLEATYSDIFVIGQDMKYGEFNYNEFKDSFQQSSSSARKKSSDAVGLNASGFVTGTQSIPYSLVNFKTSDAFFGRNDQGYLAAGNSESKAHGKLDDKAGNFAYMSSFNESIRKRMVENKGLDNLNYSKECKYFKPFLILNSSNLEDQCVQAMFSRVETNAGVSREELTRENPSYNDPSRINEAIGFIDYINMAGRNDIKQVLEQSSSIANYVVQSILGYKGNWLQFIMDLSPEWLFTIEDIVLAGTEGDCPLWHPESNPVLKEYYEFNPERFGGNFVDPSIKSERIMDEFILDPSPKEDFSNQDVMDKQEEERLEVLFEESQEEYSDDWESLEDEGLNEDTVLDIFGENTQVVNTDISSIQSKEFEATVREAEALLKRLEELGVNVSINSGVGKKDEEVESLQRVENRSIINFSESEDMWENPEVSYDRLFEIVTNDVVKTFGGLERFKSFRVHGGSIGVNGYYYRSCIKSSEISNIPYDVRRRINSGNVQDLFNYRLLWNMPNLMVLEFDSMSFFQEYIQPLYRGEVSTMFKTIPSLQRLVIGKEVITREGLKQARIDEKLKEAERRKKIGDTVQGACFKGAAKSWQFNTRVFKSDNKWYLKAIGLTAGTVGTVASGTAGVGVTVGRKVVSGAKSLAGGIKKLFNE